mmetsp:Transcript_25239/g.27818  ORF Transcript_25239/g.27818 Transcript_25239/m.27818 type:complete len:300 (-) Transcript_25239:123-1022(-)
MSTSMLPSSREEVAWYSIVRLKSLEFERGSTKTINPFLRRGPTHGTNLAAPMGPNGAEVVASMRDSKCCRRASMTTPWVFRLFPTLLLFFSSFFLFDFVDRLWFTCGTIFFFLVLEPAGFMFADPESDPESSPHGMAPFVVRRRVSNSFIRSCWLSSVSFDFCCALMSLSLLDDVFISSLVEGTAWFWDFAMTIFFASSACLLRALLKPLPMLCIVVVPDRRRVKLFTIQASTTRTLPPVWTAILANPSRHDTTNTNITITTISRAVGATGSLTFPETICRWWFVFGMTNTVRYGTPKK